MKALTFVGLVLAIALGACSTPALHDDGVAALSVVKPEPRPCPAGVASGTRCLAGRDAAGAFYWIAVPAQWNGVLVLHAHGGPELGAPSSARTERDLTRWSVWTRAGFAWAGTSFHQGGVAVHSAAQDVERLRRLFNTEIGVPRRTILHGQSWGASVAAVAAETYTVRDASGRPPFDAVLLTSGVLGGGTLSYDFRLDLRVVYEAVCGNHPRADEAPYPLWQGLPPGNPLTRAELRQRVNDCTGVDDPPGPRSDVQRHNLKTLLDVIHIPARSLVGHLQWATYHFQDIVFKRLDGRNPFGNEGVRYRGSDNDDVLNARVARYRADPVAVAAFAADTDPSGRIPVPVLTLHAIGDPIAFVELESTWRDTMQRAGTAGHLVQVFSDDHEHSYLSDAEYLSAMHALLAWVERGTKPTPAGIAAQCHLVDAAFDPACRFVPDYRPQPLATRVPARVK